MRYIYLLTDPRTSVVRYVGNTSTPKNRFQTHRGGRDDATGEWIRALRREGVAVGTEIVCRCSDGIAPAIERGMIAHYGHVYPGQLLNRTREVMRGFGRSRPDEYGRICQEVSLSPIIHRGKRRSEIMRRIRLAHAGVSQ